MNFRSLLIAAAACAWVGAVPALAAPLYPLAPLVRSGQPIPGMAGGFTFLGEPGISDDTVTFIADTAAGKQGVYTWSAAGGIHTVADTSTPRPGGSGNFAGFFEARSDGTRVAFRDNTATGIYDNTSGTLRLTAGTSTAVPGGGGNFSSVFSPSLEGSKVVFSGRYGSSGDGVFARNGDTLIRIADTTTPIPGSTGTFAHFGATAVAGDDVTFGGDRNASSLHGIYSTRGGLHAIADTSTPIPQGTGNFSVFNITGYHATDGADTVFIGDGPGQEGIYARFGDAPLIRIADRNTSIPGTSQKLTSFGLGHGPAIDHGHILFYGSTGNFSDSDGGLFLYADGEISTLIRRGDALDGKTVSDLSYSPDSLSGNQAVFTAHFTDGSSGIYAATVPEPAAVICAAGLAWFLAAWRRRA